jgi:hypothetical protein
MLTIILKAVLVGAFAFVVALAVFLMMQPSDQPQQYQTNQPPANEPQEKAKENDAGKTFWQRMLIIWRNTTNDAVAFFTFWLAIFSGMLVIVAVFQVWLLLRAEHVANSAAQAAKDSADAAKRSAEISERALIVGQRAVVRAVNFPWLWRPDIDRPGKYFYDITPIIENVGGSVTDDMKIVVDSALRETELPKGFDFPYRSEPVGSIIGAKQSVGASNVIILDDDLLSVQQGKKFFYIWGTIKYRDGFENTPIRTTEFCTQIVRIFGNPLDPRDPNNPKGTSVEIGFRIYPEHNKAN